MVMDDFMQMIYNQQKSHIRQKIKVTSGYFKE